MGMERGKGKILNANEIVPIIEKILNGGGECKLKVTGFSMTPILRNGIDSVILTSPLNRNIKEGEIVFIKRKSGKYVLHRVYSVIDENYFVMNGDAQQWTEIINTKQVIGVAKSIIRKNKEISCDKGTYRIFIKAWMKYKPIRRSMLNIYWKSKNINSKLAAKKHFKDKKSNKSKKSS